MISKLITEFRGGRKMTESEKHFKLQILHIVETLEILDQEEIETVLSNERSTAILNFYTCKILEQKEGRLQDDKNYMNEFFELLSSGEWKKYLNWD